MRILAIVAWLSISCTGSANYWVAYSPISGTATSTKATAVQRAIIAMTDAGREVETSDAAAGIVVSKWFAPEGMFADQQRFRYRVSVDETGAFDVVAHCQEKSAATSTWQDCGERQKRPRFVVDGALTIATSLRQTATQPTGSPP